MMSKQTSFRCDWPAPPADLKLKEDEVHVWCAALDRPPARVSELAGLLAEDEMGRARRFVFEQHRHHFIVGRGLLRLILGHYLEIEPDRLQFEYGPQGKPELAGAAASSQLSFNLSHSGGLALYAVTYQRQIGVDVEAIRQLEDMEMIAYRFFSAAEYTALMALPPTDRPVGFFNCWTRKEAYIKAVGDGLIYPLEKFDVSLQPGQAAKLLQVRNDPAAVNRWTLQHLDPAPGYVGALAVAGSTWQLRCWQWLEGYNHQQLISL